MYARARAFVYCTSVRASVFVCECVHRPHESVVDRTTITATAAPEVVPRRCRFALSDAAAAVVVVAVAMMVV